VHVFKLDLIKDFPCAIYRLFFFLNTQHIVSNSRYIKQFNNKTFHTFEIIDLRLSKMLALCCLTDVRARQINSPKGLRIVAGKLAEPLAIFNTSLKIG
jgi:hypothetical protein